VILYDFVQPSGDAALVFDLHHNHLAVMNVPKDVLREELVRGCTFYPVVECNPDIITINGVKTLPLIFDKGFRQKI